MFCRNSIGAPLVEIKPASGLVTKPVLAIIERRTAAGILTTPAVGNTGKAGKFERAIPTIFVLDRPQRMLTQWFSNSLMVMSASGRSFT